MEIYNVILPASFHSSSKKSRVQEKTPTRTATAPLLLLLPGYLLPGAPGSAGTTALYSMLCKSLKGQDFPVFFEQLHPTANF